MKMASGDGHQPPAAIAWEHRACAGPARNRSHRGPLSARRELYR